MTRTPMKRTATLLAALLAALGFPRPVHAAAFFSQFGTPPPILTIGEGATFALGGVSRAGVVEPALAFHLHLFFNEGIASGPPEITFSPGDVLRFTMGGTPILYQYDNGGNILQPAIGQSGFFNGGNIDDNFASDDPIGIAFAAADTNGTRFSLEVLAGDGVRFSGLEFSDTVAGTFQMGGASTLVRKFDVRSGETVMVDFDSLLPGDVVNGQFQVQGLTFLGDRIVDEQVIIDRRGAELERLEGRMLVNQSTTPPFGRSGFVGIRFERPVEIVSFDFVGPDPVLAGGFTGDFSEDNLMAFQSVSPSPGPSGLLEGSAQISFLTGFDGAVIAPSKGAAGKGILIDSLAVSFSRIATIDFEGMSEATAVNGQFAGMGVSFFGDEVLDERGVIDERGVGYERLEGILVVNSSTAPPLAEDGFLGMRFDAPVSSVSFDYSGPSPLRVFIFRGDFAPGNVVQEREFFTSTSSTGFPEGRVSFIDPAGFDGLLVAEHGSVVIDNLHVVFLR